MKQKKYPLNKLCLRHHPRCNDIVLEDHITYVDRPPITLLPCAQAQIILDQTPIVACKNKTPGEMDWQLAPNPTVELLKCHPEQDRLVATVNYYPDTAMDDVLIASLLILPALTHRQQKKALSSLFHRIKQCKGSINAPTRQVLAQWANVSTTAIRHIGGFHG